MRTTINLISWILGCVIGLFTVVDGICLIVYGSRHALSVVELTTMLDWFLAGSISTTAFVVLYAYTPPRKPQRNTKP